LSSAGSEAIAVNGTDIDFDFSGTVSSGFPPIATSGTVDGTGDSALFDITGASTGSFGGLLIGTGVTVHDLDSTLEPVGTTSGASLPLANFLTFSFEPGWTATLTEILPGVDTAAVCGAAPVQGQSCTPPGSPFNLTNEAGNQVLVGFSFLGTATDGLGDNSLLSGTFSTTLSGTNYQAVLTALEGGQAVVSAGNASIDFTAVSTTPEPGSIIMVSLGGLLIGCSVVRQRAQRR
jgi:hypothetical protein